MNLWNQGMTFWNCSWRKTKALTVYYWIFPIDNIYNIFIFRFLVLTWKHWNQMFADSQSDSFCCYLADDGELWSVDMVTIDSQWEHCSQRHHAAHCCHIVEIRLRVLDVTTAFTHRENKGIAHYLWLQATNCEMGLEIIELVVLLLTPSDSNHANVTVAVLN